jgi:hypothetical protein
MNRYAEFADFFLAGCAILPLPLLFNFGPVAALGAMVPLLLLGCYFGALEQLESGEGPLFGHTPRADDPPQPEREPRR